MKTEIIIAIIVGLLIIGSIAVGVYMYLLESKENIYKLYKQKGGNGSYYFTFKSTMIKHLLWY